MIQLLKFLLHKQKDLSSDPKNSHKYLDVHTPVLSALWKQDRRILGFTGQSALPIP